MEDTIQAKLGPLILKLALVAATLAAFGCATGNHELMAKQLQDLSGQLTDLRKSQSTTSVTLEDLETRLFLVQDELDTQRKRNAFTQRRLNILPVVRVKRTHGPSAEFDPQADRAPLRTNDSPEFEPQETLTPVRRPPLSEDQHAAVKLYKKSFEDLKQRRYQSAIDGFRNFVEKYPTHNYADNAIYWMGECYYDRRLWVKALSTFQKVIQNYPMGNKAPDAMLKIGLSHQQLKNLRQAREVLMQVTEIYPRSPIAQLAKKKLVELK